MLAPEHYGCESTGPWTGEHAFTLADEAARAIALIDQSEGKVHLVGHSYGGGVALHVALARPERIASMALYEPSAFHLLRQMGERGAEAFAEITSVARRTLRRRRHRRLSRRRRGLRRLLERARRVGCDASGGAGRADPLGAQRLRSTSAH